MAEARERVVYRIFYRTVKTDPPSRESLTSNKALGRPPRGAEIRDPSLWDGLSVMDTLELALERAREYPMHGAYVAELTFSDDILIVAKKTGGRGHYTLYGAADTLRACITRVYPVDRPEEGQP